VPNHMVEGRCAPGFEVVVDAFEDNFKDGVEVGAAVAVSRNGELVVDVWGGDVDHHDGGSWSANTLCPVFSGTKGMIAVCLGLLLQAGDIRLDDPVSEYWPEFGKPDVLVRDVAAHASRLPGVLMPVSVGEFLDSAMMAEVLAEQPDSRDPRARRCYHPFTFGWICSELVRRADGRTLSDFFQQEVATPLDLELWIGLPSDEEYRVAVLSVAESWTRQPFLSPELHHIDPFQASIWANPPVMSSSFSIWNEARTHAAGVPGAGGIGTARAMARMYDLLPCLLSPQVLQVVSTPVTSGWFEPVGENRSFGVGFQLADADQTLGPARAVMGHTGAGGSVHGRWVEEELGFSYVMNHLRGPDELDRARRMLTALHKAVR
jgi:CubicO group peptidase (beta-lactamase class C family)